MTDAQHLVLALFTAQPSHPGRSARTLLESVQARYPERVRTSIVDAATQWRVMEANGIVDVPTFAICENGRVKEALPCGVPDESSLCQVIERHL
ncbi:hypothetical protein [Streptomyces sp. ODS05-4]|uniref:hypothetical protein n=1 Tax=Streptomyces sp. ODS05-4 TaxID=2944939 RepID=UPI00210AD6F2|nr:hypothetical protein [Streptomyces sp. ODS05-4]